MSGPSASVSPAPPAQALSPTAPTEKLEGEALLTALKQQLEFYFSKQNLQQDAYLVSQVNTHKRSNT